MPTDGADELLQQLCGDLRSLRRQAGGPSLRALAERVNVSKSQLGAILNGQVRELPDWRVIRGTVRCIVRFAYERERIGQLSLPVGADEFWRSQYGIVEHAFVRSVKVPCAGGSRRRSLTRDTLVPTDGAHELLQQLCGDLRSLRRQAGGPSLRALAERVNVSKSQLGAILNGQVRELPDWRVIRGTVRCIVRFAYEHERVGQLSLPVGADEFWRSQYGIVEHAFVRSVKVPCAGGSWTGSLTRDTLVPTDGAHELLQQLCGDLRSLRRQAGGPSLRALAERVNVSKSQLGAILNGQVRELPDWRVIRGTVRCIVRFAYEHERVGQLSLPVGADEFWRSQYGIVEHAFARSQRPPRIPSATAPAPAVYQPPPNAPAQLPLRARPLANRPTSLRPLPTRRAATAGTTATIDGTAGVGAIMLALWSTGEPMSGFADELFADPRGFDPSGVPMDPTEVLRGILVTLGVLPAGTVNGPDTWTTPRRGAINSRHELVPPDNVGWCAAEATAWPAPATAAILIRQPGFLPAGGADRPDPLTVGDAVHPVESVLSWLQGKPALVAARLLRVFTMSVAGELSAHAVASFAGLPADRILSTPAACWSTPSSAVAGGRRRPPPGRRSWWTPQPC